MAIDVDDEKIWETEVKRLLRAEMTRRGVSYDDLTEKLAATGVRDTSANIRNKVARGKFSAAFMLQCLRALDVEAMRLKER